jgi:MFS family permease
VFSPWRVPSYRWIVAGASFFSFGVFGASTWLPAMLERSYGVGPAAAGMMLGPLFGVAGAAGTLFGGWAGQVLSRRDARWALWLPAIAAALCVPLVVAAFLSHALYLTVGLYAVAYCLSFIYMGPIFATVQTLVAPNGRATATAWMMFFVNLIGIGLGPQLVGMLSDLFNALGSAEPLRYALAVVAAFFVVPAIAFTRAARTMVVDAENSRQQMTLRERA